MVKFLFLKLLYAFTTLGFSALHGLHQLAQKSTSTYLPRKELSFTSFPSVSGNTISGAVFPTRPPALVISSSNERLTDAIPACAGNFVTSSVRISFTDSLSKGSILNAGLFALPWYVLNINIASAGLFAAVIAWLV